MCGRPHIVRLSCGDAARGEGPSLGRSAVRGVTGRMRTASASPWLAPMSSHSPRRRPPARRYRTVLAGALLGAVAAALPCAPAHAAAPTVPAAPAALAPTAAGGTGPAAFGPGVPDPAPHGGPARPVRRHGHGSAAGPPAPPAVPRAAAAPPAAPPAAAPPAAGPDPSAALGDDPFAALGGDPLGGLGLPGAGGPPRPQWPFAGGLFGPGPDGDGAAELWTGPLADPYPVSAPYGTPGGWQAGYHTGVDFALPEGVPVLAVGPGTVVVAGPFGDYGKAVVLRMRDGHHVLYAHLSEIAVAAEQEVGGGEVLGASGNTGRSTGPHLHFEVRTARAYGTDIDPVAYLRAKGVEIG